MMCVIIHHKNVVMCQNKHLPFFPKLPQIPESDSYPYRAPRIDEHTYQAELPPLPGSVVTDARVDAGGTAAARKARQRERARTPVQRMKDAISRITAASAFASPPEAPLWNPTLAFAANSPEQSAWPMLCGEKSHKFNTAPSLHSSVPPPSPPFQSHLISVFFTESFLLRMRVMFTQHFLQAAFPLHSMLLRQVKQW